MIYQKQIPNQSLKVCSNFRFFSNSNQSWVAMLQITKVHLFLQSAVAQHNNLIMVHFNKAQGQQDAGQGLLQHPQFKGLRDHLQCGHLLSRHPLHQSQIIQEAGIRVVTLLLRHHQCNIKSR